MKIQRCTRNCQPGAMGLLPLRETLGRRPEAQIGEPGDLPSRRSSGDREQSQRSGRLTTPLLCNDNEPHLVTGKPSCGVVVTLCLLARFRAIWDARRLEMTIKRRF